MTDKSQTELISVVIPFYKGERYLAEALRSVFDQTYRPLEVIVVDDGSPTPCDEILAQFDQPIHLIRQENQGVAAARNTGIQAANGEYIALLDQDDVWLPEKLARQLELMQSDPGTALVFSPCISIDKNGRERGTGKEDDISHLTGCGYYTPVTTNAGIFGTELFLALTRRCFITSCSGVLLRKRAVEEVGRFDARFPGPDDWHLYLRLTHKYATGFINTPLYLYRQGIEGQATVAPKGQSVPALENLLKNQANLTEEERTALCMQLAGRHKILADWLMIRRQPADARKHYAAARNAWPRLIHLVSRLCTFAGPFGLPVLRMLNCASGATESWADLEKEARDAERRDREKTDGTH